MQLADAEIAATVRRELQEILGISAEPSFVKIYRWPRAMAQYTIGHKGRVDRVRQIVSSASGLALAGNAYAGIGIPNCIRSGSEAATKVITDLAGGAAARAHGLIAPSRGRN